MELFKSNAQLVKYKVSENPDVWNYKLFSVITTNHSHWVHLAFDQTTFTLNTNGHFAIELKVKKDENQIIDRSYLKPIVHMVNLESVPFTETNTTIEIQVIEVEEEGGTQQQGSTTILHTSTADEDGKPM